MIAAPRDFRMLKTRAMSWSWSSWGWRGRLGPLRETFVRFIGVADARVAPEAWEGTESSLSTVSCPKQPPLLLPCSHRLFSPAAYLPPL